MARSQKMGLDYFPLDVDIDQDDKIVLVESKHGLVGFAIIVKLLMRIYKNGYYYDWTEREQLLFVKRVNNASLDLINVIVNDCIKWGLFSEMMFQQYQILTSAGIQKRYLKATERRPNVVIDGKYLLLSQNEYGLKRVQITNSNPNVDINPNSKGINADINHSSTDINVDMNPRSTGINDNIGTQSKVKESKVNKSKEYYAQTSPFEQSSFEVFWDSYPKKKSKGDAEKWFKKHDPDAVLMDRIMKKLEVLKKSFNWQKDGGQFIPYPATWLNAKGWEDEDPNEKTNGNGKRVFPLPDWYEKYEKDLAQRTETPQSLTPEERKRVEEWFDGEEKETSK